MSNVCRAGCLFTTVQILFRHVLSFKASLYAFCFCFLAVTTNATSSSGSGYSGGGCRDADPGYECTQLGELTGTKVIGGSLARCTSEKLSNTPGMKARETNLVLFQFRVSRPSVVAIEGSGLQQLVLHSRTSSVHMALGYGMNIESRLSRLAPGHYTLVGAAHDCLDDSPNKKDRYRIWIKVQASNGHAESDEPGSQPSDTRREGVIDKAAKALSWKWLYIAAGVFLAGFLLIMIASRGYCSAC